MSYETSKDKLVMSELNYGSYLRIPELLSLQQLLSNPAHHDEMFFIIVHQTAELWFKDLLHETGSFVKTLEQGVVSQSLKLLKRMTAILDLQVKQINMLATLTPVEFAGFRDHLRPASGFQSFQFRKIEFSFGVRHPFFLKFFASQPELAEQLASIMAKPSVYDILLKTLHTNGFSMPSAVLNRDFSEEYVSHPDVAKALATVYEQPGDSYHWVLLFEALLDFDEKYLQWKNTHILMVARTIGAQPGTGGSSGLEFLRGRAHLRFFPELWDLRSLIGGSPH